MSRSKNPMHNHSMGRYRRAERHYLRECAHLKRRGATDSEIFVRNNLLRRESRRLMYLVRPIVYGPEEPWFYRYFRDRQNAWDREYLCKPFPERSEN